MQSTGRILFGRFVFSVWWAMASGAWVLLSSADTLVNRFGGASVIASWNSSWAHPKWGWKVWIVGFLVITLVAVFEGSFRKYRELEQKYFELDSKINGVETRTRSCRQLLLLSVNAYKKGTGNLNLEFDEGTLRGFVQGYEDRLHVVLDQLQTENRAKQNVPGLWRIT